MHPSNPNSTHTYPPAMEKQMAQRGQVSPEGAAANFWVLDKDGLITQQRSNLPDYVARFAQPAGPGAGQQEGAGLLEVVKAVKPTVLLGLAGGWAGSG